MSGKWPLVKLGEVMEQNCDFVDRPEAKLYQKLSVKLYGRGVVLDTPVEGHSLKMQRHQLAKPGQVIVSEIWGKKGALGFVPENGAGALCTSHFFLFDINETKVLPGWLAAIFTANFLEPQLGAEAKGTTGYAAVRPKHFLAAEIPLPPLPEQRRIVARIEAATAKINEARKLREEIAADAANLLRALMESEPCEPTPMNQLVLRRAIDVTVTPDEDYEFAGVYCFGRGVFPSLRKNGSEFAYKNLSRLRAGDFTYPKLMAWEGAFGVVPPSCDGRVVSPEFPVFEVQQDRVLPEVLDIHFKTPAIWAKVAGESTGTNVRRRRLNPSDFLAYDFPLPPMAHQQKIAAAAAKVAQIKAHHQDTEEEFAALIPALLNQAFA